MPVLSCGSCVRFSTIIWLLAGGLQAGVADSRVEPASPGPVKAELTNPYNPTQAQAQNPYNSHTVATGLTRGPWEDPQAQIFRGKALNALLDELRQQQARGITGPRVEIKEEVLRQVNWAKDSGSNPGLIKYARRIPWPRTLQADQFRIPREKIDLLLRQAMEQAEKTRVSAEVVKDLVQARDQLQQTLLDQVGDLSPNQFIEARRFLLFVDGAVKALEGTDIVEHLRLAKQMAARVKTVADLVQFMGQNKLRFTPMLPGEQAAYESLYKSLLVTGGKAPKTEPARATPNDRDR
jgi:hypothetical protein